MSVQRREVSDEVNRELFERQGGRREDGSKWGASWMMINLVLLANGTSSDEGIDK